MFSISSSSWLWLRFWVPCHVSQPGSFARLLLSGIIYLECKVLQEVCGAVGLVRLGARAGIYPHTNSRSLGVWRVLGGNLSKSCQSTCGIAGGGWSDIYGEAIAQSGALGLCSMANRGGQTTEKGRLARLDRVDGSAAAQTLLQVECKPAGSH